MSKRQSKRKDRGAHGNRRRARRRALQGVYQSLMTGQSAHEIYQQFLDEQDMRTVDLEYFKALLTETVGAQEELVDQYRPILDRDWDNVDPMERAILLVAGNELRQHMEVPYRVILDEAIDLAKDFGSEQCASYVNGVLDKASAIWRQVEQKAHKG